jgi:transposase
MDPHKRSATIEIINSREKVLAQGRFGTDRDGYATMLKLDRQHKDRVWAVEGSPVTPSQRRSPRSAPSTTCPP